MRIELWIHWFMVAFFAGMGFWFVANRSCFGFANPYCGDDDAYADVSERRLAAAYRRRARRERDFGATPGLLLSGFSFALAVVAATTAVPVATLYAAFTVALATVSWMTSGLVRRSHRRAASLAVRSHGESLRAGDVTLVASATLSPLVWVRGAPLAAIAVACAGLAIVTLAVRVASGPSELEGDDARVEAFVDRRVRIARVVGLLALAPASAFVFASFSGWTEAPARVAALALAFAACAAGGWRVRGAIRRPSSLELDTWLHVAP